MKELQSQFLASKGDPIPLDGHSIVQMDRVPIQYGTIKIAFMSNSASVPQGVAIKSVNGFILLGENSKSSLLCIWDSPVLPRVAEYTVDCPSRELRIWNIYKASGLDTKATEGDSWTNNAGMIVEDLASAKRRYHCSDGIGPFNPKDFVFELEWFNKIK